MIQGIIFDMDGVIVKTEEIHYETYQETLQNYGIKITEEEYNNNWIRDGKGIEDFLKLKKLNIDPNHIRNKKRELYQSRLRTNVPIFDGVIETLESLSNIFPLALATSSYRIETDLILEKLNIKKYFQSTITANDVSIIKPHPECFLSSAAVLTICPEKTLVIEDAQKGVIAAKRAGMYCIAIPNNYTLSHDLSKVDLRLNSIKELTPSLIKSLYRKQ